MNVGHLGNYLYIPFIAQIPTQWSQPFSIEISMCVCVCCIPIFQMSNLINKDLC